MDLTWRPATDDDAPAIAELVTHASTFDGTPEPVTAEQVLEGFAQPRFERAEQTLTVWDADTLVAYGTVWPSDGPVEGRALVMIPGTVHPDCRGHGVGSDLLAALEERAASRASGLLPGLDLRVRSIGGLEGSPSEALLRENGYEPDNRFVTMHVVLADWVDPGGDSTAVAPDAALLAATRDAHNDAFRDHRNSSEIAEDRWESWQGTSDNRPQHARVIAEQGRVLAYAMADERPDGVLHTGILGTRREARGRGLAREVLLATLRGARDAGYRIAELEVDSTSPTGADRLYESVGYRPVRTISRWVKDVPTR